MILAQTVKNTFPGGPPSPNHQLFSTTATGSFTELSKTDNYFSYFV